MATYSAPKIVYFGLEKNTGNKLVVQWSWAPGKHTEKFEVYWEYYSGEKTNNSKHPYVIHQNYTDVSNNKTGDRAAIYESSYTIPSNARQVFVSVKPIAEKKSSGNNKSSRYWTAERTSTRTFNVSSKAIEQTPGPNDPRLPTPSAPTLSLDGDDIIITATNPSDSDAAYIEFVVERPDLRANTDEKYYNSIYNVRQSKVKIVKSLSTLRFEVYRGTCYRAKCRCVNGKFVGKWSDYSAGDDRSAWLKTRPAIEAHAIKKCTATKAEKIPDSNKERVTEVYLEWIQSRYDSAESYTIEYTDDQKYFGTAGGNVSSVTVSGDNGKPPKTNAYLTGFPSDAKTLYFRIRGNNSAGSSGWSYTVSLSATTTDKSILDLSDPITPPVPTVKLDEDGNIVMSVSNVGDLNAKSIRFEFVRPHLDAAINEKYKNTFRTGHYTVKIIKDDASYTLEGYKGSKYKVRCRSIRGELMSEWSDYTDYIYTLPLISDDAFTVYRPSKTSEGKITEIELKWKKALRDSATGYEIWYSTELDDLNINDKAEANGKKISIPSDQTFYKLTGVDAGKYYFRIRATNSAGHSGWSNYVSVSIGEAPNIPATWSLVDHIVSGESVTLYWTHNPTDGSSETKAEIKIRVISRYDGSELFSDVYSRNKPEEEKDKNGEFLLSTLQTDSHDAIPSGIIKWQVRTAGISGKFNTDGWSAERTIDVFPKQTYDVELWSLYSNSENISSLPLVIQGQLVGFGGNIISVYYQITSASNYIDLAADGSTLHVHVGDTIYSKFITGGTDDDAGYKYIENYEDTYEESEISEHRLQLGAGLLNLQSGQKYDVKCTVTTDYGATKTARKSFTFTPDENRMLEENDSIVGATFSVDEDNVVIYINPTYASPDNEVEYESLPNVWLSVYRCEYDGTFTLIADKLPNREGLFVVDPHPSLNNARYRIVCLFKDTGETIYNDLVCEDLHEKSIVMKWNEDWYDFETLDSTELSDMPWSGSILRLPYNIDISDKNSPDVALVKYAGRKFPVSYYGTQIGESATWSTVIPADDDLTLYELRRLSKWMGDVYVQEPSGIGYWANVKISMDIKHNELTIPVQIDITRVEGGK